MKTPLTGAVVTAFSHQQGWLAQKELNSHTHTHARAFLHIGRGAEPREDSNRGMRKATWPRLVRSERGLSQMTARMPWAGSSRRCSADTRGLVKARVTRLRGFQWIQFTRLLLWNKIVLFNFCLTTNNFNMQQTACFRCKNVCVFNAGKNTKHTIQKPGTTCLLISNSTAGSEELEKSDRLVSKYLSRYLFWIQCFVHEVSFCLFNIPAVLLAVTTC